MRSTLPCRGSQEDSATLHGHIQANMVNEHEDPVETRASVGGVLASVDDSAAKKENVVNRSRDCWWGMNALANNDRTQDSA